MVAGLRRAIGQGEVSEEDKNWLGVASGKEVNGAVNIRGVTHVSHLHLEVDVLFYTVKIHGKGRPSWNMINDCAC